MLKKGDTLPGIFSFLIGAATLIYNLAHPKMAIFGKAARGGVGPGFFPFICSLALMAFGLVLVLRDFKNKEAIDYFQMTPERKHNMKAVGMLVLFVALMLAGWKISELFFLCLPVYCFAVNKLLKQSTKFSIIFTVVMTAFVYVLFNMAFTIRFKP